MSTQNSQSEWWKKHVEQVHERARDGKRAKLWERLSELSYWIVILGAFVVVSYAFFTNTEPKYQMTPMGLQSWNSDGFMKLIWPLNLNSKRKGLLGEKASMALRPGSGCRTFGHRAARYGTPCYGMNVRNYRGRYVPARSFYKGVDISAPAEFPIFAMGDGVVIFAARKYGIYDLEKKYRNIMKYPKLRQRFLRFAPRHVSRRYKMGGFDTLSKRYKKMVRYGRWWGSQCGNTLIIKYLNGLVKVVHCSSHKVYVTKGMTVKRGQLIATVGTTGNSTGEHFHMSTRIYMTQDGRKGYYYIAPRFLLPLNIPVSYDKRSYISEYDAKARFFVYSGNSFPRRFVKPPALLYPLARMVGSEAPYAYKKGYAQHGKKQYWMLRELITEVGMNRYLLYNKLGKAPLTPKDILIGRGLRKYGTQHSQPGTQFATHRKPHLKDIALAGKKIWGFLPHMSAKYGYVTRYHFTGVQTDFGKIRAGVKSLALEKQRCKSGLYLAPMFVRDILVPNVTTHTGEQIYKGGFVPKVTFYGETRMLTAKGLKQLVPTSNGCMSAPRNGFKNPAESIKFYGIHEKMYLVDTYKSTPAVNTPSK